MMLFTIKNVGESQLEVPMARFIPQATPPVSVLGPGDSVSYHYVLPPANHEVSDAMQAWVAEVNAQVEYKFEPRPIESPPEEAPSPGVVTSGMPMP